MKNLPDIGTNVLVIMDSDKQVVTIIAHYQDKAVYVYKTRNNFSRVDMATASWFKEVDSKESEQNKPTGCGLGEHNYIQIDKSSGPANLDRAFCTRCGNTITLE